MDASAAAIGNSHLIDYLIIGVDIGSLKSVLAAVRKGGIDIILSDTTSKQIPMVVAFTDEERTIGDAAMNQQKKNFKNTLQFFTRFIGLNTDCVEQLKKEEPFVTYKIVPLENKKVGFEVSIRGQNHIVTPEQVLAYYFRKIKTFFENSAITSNDIVISVPSYFSNVERQGVLDAAEIAGLKCLRLINESTAIALNYGFFRKADLPEKDARIVAFVDLGHSKTTVTIASFLKGKTRIVIHKSDRNLGARNMDALLVDILGGEFNKKYGADPRKNVRARLRMLDVIEKQRKILSGVKDATIHLESLLEDEDLHKNINRQEFEDLIKPMIEDFKQLLIDTLEQSGKYYVTVRFMQEKS
jgi:heat shock protein 4